MTTPLRARAHEALDELIAMGVPPIPDAGHICGVSRDACDASCMELANYASARRELDRAIVAAANAEQEERQC